MDPNQPTQPAQSIPTPQPQMPVQPVTQPQVQQNQPPAVRADLPKNSIKKIIILLIVLFVVVVSVVVIFYMGQNSLVENRTQIQLPQTVPTTLPFRTQEEKEVENIDTNFDDSDLKEIQTDLQGL